jgi:hypothetical protein
VVKTDTVSTDEQRAIARSTVAQLISSGKIKRGYCWCGRRADGHHPDYSEPLIILWLCPKHHGGAHRNIPVEIPPTHKPVDLSNPTKVNKQTAKIEKLLGGAKIYTKRY